MVGFVKLIGILMVALGVIFFIKPNTIKKAADFFAKESRLYIGSVLNIFVGIMLIGAASQCAVSWIVALFGILCLVKGVLIFVLGKQKIKSLLDMATKKPNNTLRLLSIVHFFLGVLLIYSV